MACAEYGAYFGLLGLSQWSFEYIEVALYTITKSTSIVFILMFSLLFRLEKKHWSLIIIVIMISTGLTMFTYKSTDFVLLGFMMVLTASFLSGMFSIICFSLVYTHSLNFRYSLDPLPAHHAEDPAWSLQSHRPCVPCATSHDPLPSPFCCGF